MNNIWNNFWYKYWDKKLTRFLERNSNTPFYYLKDTVQFQKIYNKKEFYKCL